MKLLVVGGHSRNVGKTGVVVAIISAFPELDWTAAKISQYEAGECPINGKGCGCLPHQHTFLLTEETDPGGEGDTRRFLAAGAKHAFWRRAKRERFADAVPVLMQAVAGAESVVVESNSVLRFLCPTLHLVVLDPGIEDFKDSSREFLERADAFLLCSPLPDRPPWPQIPMEIISRRPAFLLEKDQPFSPELRHFVADRLGCATQAG